MVSQDLDTTRILVVDDTVTYRKVLSDLLSGVPGIELVGTAPNGRIALQKIEQLRPDLVTLDLEMPEMNGLDVLRELRSANSSVGAIMLSAFTTQGAEETIAALSLGAFDFVLKPSGHSVEESRKALQSELIPKIQAFARAAQVRRMLGKPGAASPAQPKAGPSPDNVVQRMA